MNCVQQIGRLTAAPVPLKTTDHGPVTSFRIAVGRPKGATKDADFFTVEAWQRLAEVCCEHLDRGREVAVDGRLEQREWRTPSDELRERVVIVARSIRFLRKAQGHDAHAGEVHEDDIPF